jgi:hypothetical protein
MFCAVAAMPPECSNRRFPCFIGAVCGIEADFVIIADC